MANLRGFSDSTGNRKKQRKKHTAAPTLQAMNINIRSHRLTGETLVKSAFATLGRTGFSDTSALRVKHHQTQELDLRHLDRAVQRIDQRLWGDLQARKLSSSSRRLAAGKGAPGASCVGSCTYPPPPPNGFRDCSLERNGVDEELVFTGTSGSRRDQPNELTESRKDVEAMVGVRDKPRQVPIGGAATTLCLQTRPQPLCDNGKSTGRDATPENRTGESAGPMHDGKQYVRADDLQVSTEGWLKNGDWPAGQMTSGLDFQGARGTR